MVRLKDGNRDKKTAVILFQFHYGTIKSTPPLRPPALPAYFNSTMVRLKVNDWMAGKGYQKNFNSTMVRLKASR